MGYQDDKAGPKALAVRVLVCLVCSKQKTKVFFRETLMAKRGGGIDLVPFTILSTMHSKVLV